MKLFISYAPKDEAFCDELNTHLALLKRQGVIDTWDARDITAGTDRAEVVENNLNTANIILLLISPDYIASDYCYDTELRQALDRHRNGEARVIPIILRPCDWKFAPFSKFAALPIAPNEGVKAITQWGNRDEAFLAIAKGIRKVVEELNAIPTASRSDVPKGDWIEAVRSRCCKKILYQHGTIQLLNGTEIGVDQLYVDVWVLDRSPRTFQVSESKLLESFDLRNDRLGLGDRIKRNEGIVVANANSRLLILGKPGAGKTTFLKHLAVDCCNGRFQSNLIPVLIELRRIRTTDWELLDAISEEVSLDKQQTQSLLEQGKLLILMDGLDEVPTTNFRRNVQDQLRNLAQEPKYSDNRFIITCRTQIIEVTPQGFTSVEVADFNDEQIEKFVKNWFLARGQTETEMEQQWQAFAGAIQSNSALKELTVTPVLLSLMCLVLQDVGELPSQAALLYRKGIRLLLEKWNDRKEISEWEIGNEVYRKLEPEQKEALLTEIAAQKFENPNNFVLFEQQNLAEQIASFLNLGNVRKGEAVLKAMEAQHGLLVERADELWSFSHLSFQEYFTAQWLNQLQHNSGLADKIIEKRWQDVVKLAIRSQQPADRLLQLIKQAVDYSIFLDSKLQRFLTWVQEKVEAVNEPYKSSAIRAFYFTLAFELNFILNFTISRARVLSQIRGQRDHDIDIGYALALAHARDIDFDCDIDLANALHLDTDRAYALNNTHSSEINYNLVFNIDLELENKLRLSLQNQEISQHWWITKELDWAEELRQAMIEHRNIGHDWQFTEAQTQSLQHYYDSNNFLVELLNQPGAVSDTVRQEIEDNLLLPIATLRERLPEMYGEL